MKQFFDWFLRDKHGKLVLGQRPNAPIIGWAVTAAVAYLVHQTHLHSLFTFVSHALLFTWAWLEITKGVTPLRRVLGTVVMFYLIWQAW